jgi:hypothetical protein
MKYIHATLEKQFIFALNKEDKANGRYTRIDSIQCQVFTNKDDSTGTLYLISNDLSATAAPLETIYQKRWKVEVFHKSIKSNTSMAKSPARTVRTQSNPIFMSLYATARLEILSAQQGLNKFALKSKLYINAIRQAFDELQQLKSATA